MATFKDKFLEDLDDLSAEEVDKDEERKSDEGMSEEEDQDFKEYQEREQKVEKLLSKGY